ncbi:MAG TPA: glutathione S-transferase family protein [Polyangiaceae bacterium]|jgi:glutathione S-transferase
MKIHYNPYSSNSRRAIVVALHLGAKVDFVLVDLGKGEQRRPEFLRLNPNAKVPVLEDGDFALWESNTIAEYLCDLTPKQTLLPHDLKARADVLKWTHWTSAHFAPAVGILGFENFVKKLVTGQDADPKEVARGEKLVTDLLMILERQLEGREWLAQDRVTLADYAVASTVFARARIKLPSLPPRVAAWIERVESQSAWKQAEKLG